MSCHQTCATQGESSDQHPRHQHGHRHRQGTDRQGGDERRRPGAPDLLESRLGNLSPNTVRRVYEQIWGDVYQDPTVSLRERTIATIAGLTAIGGGETNLKLQVHVGLNAGLTPGAG